VEIPSGVWYRQIAFAPDGRTLVTNQFESRGMFSPSVPVVQHWHLAPAAGGWRVGEPTHTAAPSGAALVGGSALVLVGLWGIQVCPLDPTEPAPLMVPDVAQALSVAAAPRRELIVVATDGWLRVWHLRAGKPVAAWSPSQQSVPSLAFSPDGRVLATGEANGAVRLLDPLTGRPWAEFDFDIGAVRSLAYAPDGLTLAVAGRKGLVVVDID
jgi:WD40 repeat protein